MGSAQKVTSLFCLITGADCTSAPISFGSPTSFDVEPFFWRPFLSGIFVTATGQRRLAICQASSRVSSGRLVHHPYLLQNRNPSHEPSLQRIRPRGHRHCLNHNQYCRRWRLWWSWRPRRLLDGFWGWTRRFRGTLRRAKSQLSHASHASRA